MKKFILLITLLLTSCGTPEPKLIFGSNFEFEIPGTFKTFDYKEECGHIWAIGDLRFVEFDQCWKDSSKVEMYDFDQTYKVFRAKFVDGGKVSSDVYNDGRIVETVSYNKLSNDFIYQPKTEIGTIAMWRKGVKGYALIDENNEYQTDGTFGTIVNKFKFLDN